MVNNTQGLDATFAALADPTRRAILARLARGESTVMELAGPFDVSLPAISRHLKVLERAGLLAREIDGRVHRCRLDPRPLEAAGEWVARYRRFWESQLDALDRYLKDSDPTHDRKERTRWPVRRATRTRRSTSGGPSPRRERRSSGRGPRRKR